MRAKLSEVRKVIREEIRAITRMASIRSGSPKLFAEVYNFLNNAQSAPRSATYGEFAGSKAILWQADGSIIFLTNIIYNLMQNSIERHVRKVIELAAIAWLNENGFEVSAGRIKKDGFLNN